MSVKSETPNLDALPSQPQAARACPKPAPKLSDRLAQQREDEAKWREVCRLVDERDGRRCRVCQRRVTKTLSLCAERAEHHHIHARSVEPSLRFEPRNVILVCAADHLRLTRHQLVVEGPRFLYQGWRYLDASQALRFIKAEP